MTNETVKSWPTTLVELDIYELKKILKRRLKEIEELGEPEFDHWDTLEMRMQVYQRYSTSIKSISDALYAMQKLLEAYISRAEQKLKTEKIDNKEDK